MFLRTFVFGFILLFSSVASADRVDDMRRMDVGSYCNIYADLYERGIVFRNNNIPMVIKHVSAEIAHSGASAPEDAVYVIEWNSYTEQEKKFLTEVYNRGWKDADEVIKYMVELANKDKEEGYQINAWIGPEMQKYMRQRGLEACAREEAARRTMKQVKSEHMTKDRDYLRRQYQGG